MKKHNTKGFSKKAVVLLLAVVLVFGCAVGGTVAWLVTSTDPVENTFTFGNIDIKLEETEATYHVVPGVDIAKDPRVTVSAGSEPCWLFVKVDETNWLDEMTYALAEGWTALDGVNGVYYRQVATSADDQVFPVLKDNKVVVIDTLTKAVIDAAPAQPKLTFTAYAVQQQKSAAESFTAAEAWASIEP